jgi:hypothetical protein
MYGHSEWTKDGIHPNDVGLDTIAHIFYRALTGATAQTAPAVQARHKMVAAGKCSITKTGVMVSVSTGSLRKLKMYCLDGRNVKP